MSEPYLLCLSSGFRPLYRDGVLESLGMPTGTERRFRYTVSKSVSQEVVSRCLDKSLKGCAALVCYVDQSDRTQSCEIVPCRLATISDCWIEEANDKLHLHLIFKQFACVFDLSTFKDQLTDLCKPSLIGKERLPSWQDVPADVTIPLGKHCCMFQSLPSILQIGDANLWTEVIKQISHRKDFAGFAYFYRCGGVHDGSKQVTPVSGRYVLEPSTAYRVRIDYDSLGRNLGTEQLQIEPAARLNFIGGNVRDVRGGSDHEFVTFQTTASKTSDETTLQIVRIRSDAGAKEERNVIFHFDVTVKGNRKKAIAHAFLAGCFGTLPGLAGLLTQDKFEFNQTGWVLIGITVGGFILASLIEVFRPKSG